MSLCSFQGLVVDRSIASLTLGYGGINSASWLADLMNPSLMASNCLMSLLVTDGPH